MWGYDQGGSTIFRRAGVASFFIALTFLLSVAVAQAKPDFDIAENGARAGEVVHFSIDDFTGPVSYEIEVADKDVLKGSGAGSIVLSTFTMPDLGDKSRSVTVEAEIRDAKKKKTVKEKLQYLGKAPAPGHDDDDDRSPSTPGPPPHEPAGTPPIETPAAAPVAAAPAAPAAPAVTHLPLLRPPSSGTPRSAGRHKSRKHRKSAKSHRVAHRRAHHERSKHNTSRRSGGAKLGKSRVRIPLPRTAPLFDGVPEPGTRRTQPGDSHTAGKSGTPPTAALAATRTAADDGGINAALLVPALLAIAGIGLACTATMRRRRTHRR
jgi:hypothetical protein